MSTRFARALAFVLALSFSLAGCGGGGGAADVTPPPETVGQVVAATLKSDHAAFTYALQIYLPQSYTAGTATYPVIYATEGDAPLGQAGWPLKSRFTLFKEAMQARGTQAILVGISGTQRRNTDFLLPGAANYLAFISKELAPSIERQYRADPKRRALSGLSHGGYFVIAALVLEGSSGPLSFSHYLSTDSSYGGHANPAAFLASEKQLDAAGPRPLATTLFLAGVTDFNMPIVNAVYEQMAAHGHPGLVLARAEYNTSHVGSDLPAFEEALRRYFTP
jgi:hypothetical protein